MHHIELAQWRKSSYSNQEGTCVELASIDGAVGVRDSKNPQNGHFEITRSELTALTSVIREGLLDL
ncbi:DUF397 domain-containing protein [Actinomadura harenae]|uniref:DUF397 domain-containing protein n=1 Tax=Actinomadura harenae TaxID=2483351 RepID=A0A3M2M4G9_9ACTN|nr:DUF397 domain-containing protein [Actinomadura harenae]RMI44664.1 DUF397 domain-containing protein [Actinomadura harenae]